MGCLVALLARVAFIVVWVATPMVNLAFAGGWLLPLLGVIFLPITALTYVLIYIPGVGVTGWSWALVALAFLIDLAISGSGAYSNRHRFQGYRSW